jgi:hypothetical protein
MNSLLGTENERLLWDHGIGQPQQFACTNKRETGGPTRKLIDVAGDAKGRGRRQKAWRSVNWGGAFLLEGKRLMGLEPTTSTLGR